MDLGAFEVLGDILSEIYHLDVSAQVRGLDVLVHLLVVVAVEHEVSDEEELRVRVLADHDFERLHGQQLLLLQVVEAPDVDYAVLGLVFLPYLL